ncbi:aurora kinase A and ninein-interacting protein [Nematolebias whitei]|uniref:aurora kinase A and ninein-interacting protein n=1 Tax=Nematolebias whitei TaxID=451745 RepID=UPI0018998C09|nr:aurora kinase A and ninein-interacting protein [Nematolebias whitei]
MKASKAAQHNSAQEECGVWLDTAQLKGKAKQKRLARPISKLLNPLAEGEGYNLAVALNFTQTKVEMPKNKQSAMSMFFTPHRRVIHKMCSSELPNLDPVQPFSSSISAAPAVKKRGRNERLDDPGVDCERDEDVTETEAAPSQHQGGHHLSLPDYEFEDKGSEECQPPQNKTRHTEPSLLPDDSQTPFQTWTQDSQFTCSQFPESEFDPNDKNYTKKNLENSERIFLDSPVSEEVFGSLTGAEGRTLTQIPDKLHPQAEDEKENSFLNSPKKQYSVSLLGLPEHKQAEPKSTSLKHTDGRWSCAGREVHFDSTRTKLSSSPLQKPQQRNRKTDGNSWAALFTQDSEGFRVIAHRGPTTRSPLKDESNMSSGGVRSCPYKSEEEDDEEDEMLFTQDSQGNMVIKH